MSGDRKARGGLSFRAPRTPRRDPLVPDMPGLTRPQLAVAFTLILAGAFAGALLLVHLAARFLT